MQRCFNNKTGILLGILILGVSLITTSPSHALVVTPALYELSGYPGDTTLVTFTLTNENPYPVVLQPPTMSPWRVPSGEESHNPSELLFVSVNENRLTESELQEKYQIILDEGERFLRPNEAIAAKVLVLFPEDFVSGEICSMLYFEEIPFLEASPGAIILRKRIGAPVYMISKENLSAGAIISEFNIRPFGNGDMRLALSVYNPGNVHIRPRSSIEITNSDGEKQMVEVVYGPPVFPEQKSEFISRWKNGEDFLTEGEYKVHIIINYWDDYASEWDYNLSVSNGEYNLIPIDKEPQQMMRTDK